MSKNGSSTRPLKLLLDTNVLLDEYVSTRPNSAVSHELVNLALAQGHTLLYSAHAIADVHYIISRTLKELTRAEHGMVLEPDVIAIQEIAWSCIDNLDEIATAVGVDQSDIWLARKYRTFNSDFEDNLILAAAKRASADFIVTSDQALLTKATVAALAPQDMLNFLQTNTEIAACTGPLSAPFGPGWPKEA